MSDPFLRLVGRVAVFYGIPIATFVLIEEGGQPIPALVSGVLIGVGSALWDWGRE